MPAPLAVPCCKVPDFIRASVALARSCFTPQSPSGPVPEWEGSRPNEKRLLAVGKRLGGGTGKIVGVHLRAAGIGWTIASRGVGYTSSGTGLHPCSDLPSRLQPPPALPDPSQGCCLSSWLPLFGMAVSFSV